MSLKIPHKEVEKCVFVDVCVFVRMLFSLTQSVQKYLRERDPTFDQVTEKCIDVEKKTKKKPAEFPAIFLKLF